MQKYECSRRPRGAPSTSPGLLPRLRDASPLVLSFSPRSRTSNRICIRRRRLTDASGSGFVSSPPLSGSLATYCKLRAPILSLSARAAASPFLEAPAAVSLFCLLICGSGLCASALMLPFSLACCWTALKNKSVLMHFSCLISYGWDGFCRWDGFRGTGDGDALSFGAARAG